MNISNFSELGLADPIQRALTERNHVTPTPIQAKAIPELLAGEDILGIAQTGTGKTAAFALPILHQLSQNRANNGPRSPRALILAPTRELAIQIAEEFRSYGKYLHLRQTVIYGGVGQSPQVKALNRGVEIVIATPGRLLDLMGQRKLSLNAVEYLVLDEGDRMLDMGFVHDIRKIVAKMPKKRQTFLFSATMPREIAILSGEILSDPVRVEVTPQATPIDSIEQRVYHVPSGGKKALLETVLADPALERVIVFSRTKHRANRVAEQLDKCGVPAEAIHGNKSQGARQRALKRFRSGDVRVLVATDIAARGIDISGITHVINFELPNEPENYVHRIGRTARAGAAGVALSFCDTSERAYLRDIERLIKQKLTVIGEEPTGPVPSTKSKGRGKSGKPRGGHNDGAYAGARSGGERKRNDGAYAGAKTGGEHKRNGGAHAGAKSESEQKRNGGAHAGAKSGGEHKRNGGAHAAAKSGGEHKRNGGAHAGAKTEGERKRNGGAHAGAKSGAEHKRNGGAKSGAEHKRNGRPGNDNNRNRNRSRKRPSNGAGRSTWAA